MALRFNLLSHLFVQEIYVTTLSLVLNSWYSALKLSTQALMGLTCPVDLFGNCMMVTMCMCGP